MGGNRGFSLTELMVTLVIAAIVMTAAVPSFSHYTQSNRVTAGINDLVTALHFARAEALTQQQRITICKSADGASCHTGGESGDWSQGWIVFADPDDPGSVNDGEEILRVMGPISGIASYIGNTNVVNRVSFKAQGLTDGTMGTITLCDSRGASYAAAIIISFGGRIRQATDSNDDGIVEDGDGSNVTCPG